MTVRSQIGLIGLRARLTLLLAIAMLPLAGVMAWSVASSVRSELRQAHAELARTARLGAATQADLFDSAHEILSVGRDNPDVTVGGGAACNRTVGYLLAGRPQFLTMGVVDPTSTITCHTTLRERRSFGDAPLISRVLTPGVASWQVGSFMIGKVTGKPTVAIAMRLEADKGGPGAVFVSLDLERLSKSAEGTSDGGRYEVTIVQPSTGRMLAHFPPVAVPFGTPLGDTPLVVAMRDHPGGGVVDSVGPDGVERAYAFTPVPGAESAGMMFAVGRSKAAILQDIRSVAATQMAVLVLTLVSALAATWWLVSRTQLRPIAAMARFAKDLERGDLRARVSVEEWQAPEYRMLAGTMNAAAARLEDARRKDEAIAVSESRYRMLAENTADLVTALDANGRRTFASPASLDILGREPAELMGRHPSEIAHPEDRDIVDGMLADLRSGQTVSGIRYRMRHRDGHFVWVEVGGRPLENGRGTVMGIRDITERHAVELRLEQANRKLAELASTDGLTGVVNRRGFDAALTEAMRSAARDGTDIAVMMIDVDHFKSFNDMYGHVKGDECLRAIASSMAAELRRPGDVVARYGGEEFAAILPRSGTDGAIALAKAVNDAVRKLRITHSGSPSGMVTVSVGIATMRGSEKFSALEIVGAADAALYFVKTGGRDGFAVHVPQPTPRWA